MLTEIHLERPALATSPRKAEREFRQRLLNALTELSGRQAEVLHHSDRPWTSATFTGSRHRVMLAFVGERAIEAGEEFIAELPEHEFDIPGQLVADALVIGVEHDCGAWPHMTVEVELLLLEEA